MTKGRRKTNDLARELICHGGRTLPEPRNAPLRSRDPTRDHAHGPEPATETGHGSRAAGIVGTRATMTGAMIPYKFGSSDGLFNLGSALAFVQTLPKGVYVVMNGKFFAWDNFRKNK